jgi:hypothetical protein
MKDPGPPETTPEAIALLREAVGWVLDLELKKRIDALLAQHPENPKDGAL